ncbi:unnamed protein product [Malus baccata var. baccata]
MLLIQSRIGLQQPYLVCLVFSHAFSHAFVQKITQGVRAAPFIRQTAKNYWSHASFAFVLWNLYAFQQAIELWKTNMRHPQASEVVNKDIISHFVLRLVYCRT